MMLNGLNGRHAGVFAAAFAVRQVVKQFLGPDASLILLIVAVVVYGRLHQQQQGAEAQLRQAKRAPAAAAQRSQHAAQEAFDKASASVGSGRSGVRNALLARARQSALQRMPIRSSLLTAGGGGGGGGGGHSLLPQGLGGAGVGARVGVGRGPGGAAIGQPDGARVRRRQRASARRGDVTTAT